jgi:hypothetical protein
MNSNPTYKEKETHTHVNKNTEVCAATEFSTAKVEKK